MSSNLSDEVDVAVGLHELVSACPGALLATVPDWQEEVRAHALNFGVLLQALLETAFLHRPHAKTALVQTLSPITEAVCRNLTARGLHVVMQSRDEPGTAEEMFGVSLVRDFQDYARFDLIISAGGSLAPPRDERVLTLGHPRVFPQYASLQ